MSLAGSFKGTDRSRVAGRAPVAPHRRRFAREMRNNPVANERALWRMLRNRQLDGFKFRRQAVIGPYIADFLCPERGLIVELDGQYHDAARDAARDLWLAAEGYATLRVRNTDLHEHPAGVAETIRLRLHATPTRWAREMSEACA